MLNRLMRAPRWIERSVYLAVIAALTLCLSVLIVAHRRQARALQESETRCRVAEGTIRQMPLQIPQTYAELARENERLRADLRFCRTVHPDLKDMRSFGGPLLLPDKETQQAWDRDRQMLRKLEREVVVMRSRQKVYEWLAWAQASSIQE